MRVNQSNMRSCFFLLALILLGACSTDSSSEKHLPYIGMHEVALEDQGELKKGDTIYHTIPSFSLLTQDSVELTNEDIAGKVWVAKFFFTTCPTICPPMTHAMKAVYDTVSFFSNEVVFLSFSIDPTKDSPTKLTQYIANHELTTKNWYFLTGAEEEYMHDLGVNGFYIHAEADEFAQGGYAHSPNFVLVDQQQHIRGIYDGLSEEGRKKLVADLKTLVNDGDKH